MNLVFMSLLSRNDETYMRMAMSEAEQAFEKGEVPIGAVVVLDDQVIAKAHNQVEILADATAHAEILAITQASSYIKDWRLTHAIMYATKEPCAMCAGAMVNSRLGKIVFGAADPKSGAAGSSLNITGFTGHLHQVKVVAGVLQEDCLSILQRFFRQKRAEK
jgi:tRNA(adenine34) deaminase